MSPGPRSRGTRADHHGDHTNGADGSKEATEKGLPPGLHVRSLWSDDECRSIERDIDGIKVLANAGQLKSATVDRTPFRSKYFFGYGYTYGAQVSGKGAEQLLPPEFVDPIPEWVHSKLISRLEEEEIVPRGWINSAVVNDYLPGGMIGGGGQPHRPEAALCKANLHSHLLRRGPTGIWCSVRFR